jgi:hypothetical protein
MNISKYTQKAQEAIVARNARRARRHPQTGTCWRSWRA